MLSLTLVVRGGWQVELQDEFAEPTGIKKNLDKALKVLKVWSATSGVPIKRTIANLDRLDRRAASKSRSPSPVSRSSPSPNTDANASSPPRRRPKGSPAATLSSPAGWDAEHKASSRKLQAGLDSPPAPRQLKPPLPLRVWDGDAGAGAAEAFRKQAADLNRRIQASGRRGVTTQQDWVKRYSNREEWLQEKDEARQKSMTEQWLKKSDTPQQEILSPETAPEKWGPPTESNFVVVKPPVEDWLEKWG